MTYFDVYNKKMDNKVIIHCQTALLDIEGTTTPISFVKDTLFPYVLNNISTYLDSHWNEQECIEDIQNIRNQVELDIANGINGVNTIPLTNEATIEEIKASVIKYINLLVSNDRKVTALKDLQGHMWRNAYASGDIKGEVFSDVRDVLLNWYSRNIPVYIYSSGSIEAQQLLFKYSTAGNLLQYISGHFDTRTGHKRDPLSYKTIAEEIQLMCGQILFITDIPEEAKAANEIGMKSLLITRPGNIQLTTEQLQDHVVINLLSDVTIVTD